MPPATVRVWLQPVPAVPSGSAPGAGVKTSVGAPTVMLTVAGALVPEALIAV